MIDSMTRQILDLLQSDARLSNAEVGRQVGLTPSAVLERIRKLRGAEVIEAFTARLDRRRVGYGVTAFIQLRTDASLRSAEVADQLARIPEVLEIHDVAGTDCFMLKVVARDIERASGVESRRSQNQITASMDSPSPRLMRPSRTRAPA